MKTNKILILVHGFIKNNKDMQTLEKSLQDSYESVISVSLPTTFVDMGVAVAKLCEVIANIPSSKQLTFIGHSMGGIIACRAINQLELKNVEKCIFIATPFRGSNVADFGHKIPFYSKVLKPNKNLMVSDQYLEVCNLATKNIPVGLIAGKKYSKLNLLARALLKNEHDGLVETGSVFAINATDRIVLNHNHGKIHHATETLKYVKSFIEYNKFNPTSSFA